VLNRLLFFLAKRFVSGQTVEEAVAAVRRLNTMGIQTTLDVLGENVRNRQAADFALASYLETLEWIAKAGLRSNVSLKLTQMGLDIDSSYCFQNLSRLCERAAAGNNYVRIDMESTAYTERTLSFFYELFRTHKNVGVVIQAYLYRSEHDIAKLVELGARVRLCKGAYKEPPDLAIQSMSEIRKNFMKLASTLLERGNYPAIATHDDVLINWTKHYAASHQIPRERFEFQMLYGVRSPTQRQLAAEGYNMRVYVPFGTHWLPYLYRRLRERKENIYFVLKNLFRR
jgi:proline dehydrogenase